MFFSRSLIPPECNYHIHDIELFAAIEGLEHWRHFFAYSKHPATILTYHKNLEFFAEKRSLSPCQIRYAERLSRFNTAVVYRPDVQNGADDALSRMHAPEEEEGAASTVHEALLPKPISSSPFLIAVISQQPTNETPSILNQIKSNYKSDPITASLREDLTLGLELS